MLQIHAQSLRNRREELLTKSLIEDYTNTVREIELFFTNEENLLDSFPQIVINTRLKATKTKLIDELISNGFVVESGTQNMFTVSLYNVDEQSDISTSQDATVDTSSLDVEIKDSKSEILEEPKVVVKQPTYSHTDLQMSGGSPF